MKTVKSYLLSSRAVAINEIQLCWKLCIYFVGNFVSETFQLAKLQGFKNLYWRFVPHKIEKEVDVDVNSENQFSVDALPIAVLSLCTTHNCFVGSSQTAQLSFKSTVLHFQLFMQCFIHSSS